MVPLLFPRGMHSCAAAAVQLSRRSSPVRCISWAIHMSCKHVAGLGSRTKGSEPDACLQGCVRSCHPLRPTKNFIVTMSSVVNKADVQEVNREFRKPSQCLLATRIVLIG